MPLTNDAIKEAIDHLADRIAKVEGDLKATRTAVISLRATVASLLAKASGNPVQDAYEKLRDQEEDLSHDVGSSDEIQAIRSLLMSLAARFSGKSL